MSVKNRNRAPCTAPAFKQVDSLPRMGPGPGKLWKARGKTENLILWSQAICVTFLSCNSGKQVQHRVGAGRPWETGNTQVVSFGDLWIFRHDSAPKVLFEKWRERIPKAPGGRKGLFFTNLLKPG